MQRASALAVTLLAVTAGAAGLAGAADAATKPRIVVTPKTVVAGNALTIRMTHARGRRCTLTIRPAGGHVTYKRHTRARRIVIAVPRRWAAGVRIARIACGHRSASIRFNVAKLRPAPTAGDPTTPGTDVPISEQLSLTDDLPPGDGNPNDYAVSGPANAGGAGFSSYWPLAQGATARISEGPGGSYSHYTIYTHDAVDLAIPQGTEIHAGFTGVVARVNRGCVVGNYSCGNGYGNYIYLKASDGTCAVMAHLSEIDVNPGQQVPQYTLVGRSGTTGNSTGPHLHYDHVDCTNNRSLPWSPVEGGSLAEGTTITSQNHAVDSPPAQGNPTPQPQPQPQPQTWRETVGGVAHTWTNYTNAGGTQGPSIAAYQTVDIACKIQGFRVADGNTWWYRIASAPWSNAFFVSADAFYNNGSTSGSLHGTPFVDPAVRDC